MVVVDVNENKETAPDDLGTEDELAETADLVEAYGQEILDECGAALAGPFNAMEPDEMLGSQDTTEAYLWLSSDAARYVTGTTLKLVAGFLAK